MAYLTYDEYADMGGTMTEEDFQMAEFRARKRIDFLTDSRVAAMTEVPEAVKLCMKSIIDMDSVKGLNAQLTSPAVASFSTDGYSESYGSPSEQQAVAEGLLNRQIREMLSGETDDEGTPLLYRGLCG